MSFTPIVRKEFAAQDLKVQQAYNSYDQLLAAITEKDVPEKIQQIIEAEIAEINDFQEEDGSLFVFIKKSQVTLYAVLESQLGIVAKNHYRNQWLALGLAAFGIPLGVVLGISTKNYGLIGLGMPIGLAIGMLIGRKKDEKAALEGKQLNFEK